MAPRLNSFVHSASVWALLLACGTEPSPGVQPKPATPPASEVAQQPTVATAPATAPAAPSHPKPGWSKLVIDDRVPICVFASYAEHVKVKFRDEVKKQKLRAKSSVVIGAFGLGCIHEACDDLPSLQCSVVRDGSTLVVRTHYWGYHKDGTQCTESCRPVFAGCQSPVLEAGTYTVKHGEQTLELRIPSVLRAPCM